MGTALILAGRGRPRLEGCGKVSKSRRSDPPRQATPTLAAPGHALTDILQGAVAAGLVTLLLVAPARAEPRYDLNPGDVLAISVWKEEGLERQVLVLPDGTISFPLVGEIAAAGRTTLEIQQAIIARLEPYIPDPVVTVSVVSVGGNRIYVVGEVNAPGAFQPATPITVIQALSLAGGLTEFASYERIKVLRTVDGAQVALPFDYAQVERGQGLETNIELRTGDVVMVPEKSLF